MFFLLLFLTSLRFIKFGLNETCDKQFEVQIQWVFKHTKSSLNNDSPSIHYYYIFLKIFLRFFQKKKKKHICTPKTKQNQILLKVQKQIGLTSSMSSLRSFLKNELYLCTTTGFLFTKIHSIRRLTIHHTQTKLTNNKSHV